MNILFRTDASLSIGAGHVVRCLTLAEELKRRNANVRFICRSEQGHMIDTIEKKGFAVNRLPADIDLAADCQLTHDILVHFQAVADWLIIDHYGVDSSWESVFRRSVRKIMVIDDLGNRKHNCDLLLDQNYSTDSDKYKHLVPDTCVCLEGPYYALLRPQFRNARGTLRNRSGQIERIMVFMGGVDSRNETAKVLRAIKMLNRPDIATDIVIGTLNPHREEIHALALHIAQTRCHDNVDNMASLMTSADLCIGSGGTAVWERCCVGLPSLTISIADNQIAGCTALSNSGSLIYSGWHEDVSEQSLHYDLDFMVRHPEVVRRLSSESMRLVDGNGTDRVCRYLMNNSASLNLRPANSDDCKRAFDWRNHPDVRKYCFNTDPLEWEHHQQWFENTLHSRNTRLLVAEQDTVPVGVLRYDLSGNTTLVSIYLAPEQTCAGLGTTILRRGNDWIIQNHPEIREIIAEIKSGNEASFRAFQNAGFKERHRYYVLDLMNMSDQRK